MARERRGSPRETLERLRQVAPRRTGPPVSLDTRLVEEIVHGEDIRRPLGLARAYPEEAVVRALRFQVRTPASYGGGKEPAARVRLTAADANLSIGTGPEVTGKAVALLLAVSGRRAALADLAGPGVAELEQAL
ncbi:maleylpyruvate isomerase family mycothiol-dependent enzyme [Spongiactinospora gelatinilytica]|uniref:maleylpyruvate isomerase family mycothiol-dependent enzyme n=1 Tax=Spongiactinospora gelatinilytica TaxID=2666298 RepID=UPI0018F5461A|nr:maleylpyruvate isomerase family mycothiol-dependent enzyme [Spongiactinospora gelatinilytica]